MALLWDTEREPRLPCVRGAGKTAGFDGGVVSVTSDSVSVNPAMVLLVPRRICGFAAVAALPPSEEGGGFLPRRGKKTEGEIQRVCAKVVGIDEN